MTIDVVREMLLWCIVINIGLLLWWAGFIFFAHDWVYRFHTRWIKLSVETFNAVHYAGIVFFKICLFVFIIVPYIALCIVG